MKNRILLLAAWIRARVSPLAVIVGALLVVCVATAIRAHRTEAQLAALQAQYGNAKLVQVSDEHGKKLGAVLLPQQAGDFWVNQTAASPFAIKDGSSVTRDTFETAHGRITAGGGGSDFKTVIGPCVGSETTTSCIYLIANAASASASNWFAQSDGSNSFLNSIGGSFYFYQNNTSPFARLFLTGAEFGDVSAAAPINLDWTTATAPTIKTGSAVTSLALGTTKAGATLTLAADAAANVEQFAGGTQNGVTLGANLATVGHMRTPNTFLWNARNNANTADVNVLKFSSNDTVRFGDAVNGPGAYVELNEPNAGVILGAFGGWTLLWDSSGLLATAGSVNIGTNHASGNTTTIIAGTGQSVIQASAMTAAGTGNTSIIGSMQFTTRTVTSSFTVDTTTTDNVIIVDTSGGTVTVTLPAPTNGRKLLIIDKKNSFATQHCTLAPHAAEKINGFGGSYVLTTAGYRGYVISDGTDWYTED